MARRAPKKSACSPPADRRLTEKRVYAAGELFHVRLSPRQKAAQRLVIRSAVPLTAMKGEDKKIKRACLAPSPGAALAAIDLWTLGIAGGGGRFKGMRGKAAVHIYANEGPVEARIPPRKLLPDVEDTGEVWCRCPVPAVLIGTIDARETDKLVNSSWDHFLDDAGDAAGYLNHHASVYGRKHGIMGWLATKRPVLRESAPPLRCNPRRPIRKNTGPHDAAFWAWLSPFDRARLDALPPNSQDRVAAYQAFAASTDRLPAPPGMITRLRWHMPGVEALRDLTPKPWTGPPPQVRVSLPGRKKPKTNPPCPKCGAKDAYKSPFSGQWDCQACSPWRAKPARIVPRVGMRVRLIENVNRYPHFVARAGLTGVVTEVQSEEDGGVQYAVRLDRHLPGAEEWDNQVWWNDDEHVAETFFDEVEEIPSVRRNPGTLQKVRKAVGKARVCYPAAEVVYHAGGGKRAGLTPMQQVHEGESHWWVQGPKGQVLDPAAAQFNSPVPYERGVGRGFLTGGPSRRARQLAKIAGVKLNPPGRTTDDRLRQLERAWLASGAPSDFEAYAAELSRSDPIAGAHFMRLDHLARGASKSIPTPLLARFLVDVATGVAPPQRQAGPLRSTSEPISLLMGGTPQTPRMYVDAVAAYVSQTPEQIVAHGFGNDRERKWDRQRMFEIWDGYSDTPLMSVEQKSLFGGRYWDGAAAQDRYLLPLVPSAAPNGAFSSHGSSFAVPVSVVLRWAAMHSVTPSVQENPPHHDEDALVRLTWGATRSSLASGGGLSWDLHTWNPATRIATRIATVPEKTARRVIGRVQREHPERMPVEYPRSNPPPRRRGPDLVICPKGHVTRLRDPRTLETAKVGDAFMDSCPQCGEATDLRVIDTPDETVAELQRFVVHAPPADKIPPPTPGLRGWIAAGRFVCATCVGRIFGRGCRLPTPAEPVWSDEAAPEPCVTCSRVQS